MLGEILRQLGVQRPAGTLTEFEQRLNELHDQGAKPLVALDELEVFIRLRTEFSHDFCEALRARTSNHRLALLTASLPALRETRDCARNAFESPQSWKTSTSGARRLGRRGRRRVASSESVWRSRAGAR